MFATAINQTVMIRGIQMVRVDRNEIQKYKLLGYHCGTLREVRRNQDKLLNGKMNRFQRMLRLLEN